MPTLKPLFFFLSVELGLASIGGVYGYSPNSGSLGQEHGAQRQINPDESLSALKTPPSSLAIPCKWFGRFSKFLPDAHVSMDVQDTLAAKLVCGDTF